MGRVSARLLGSAALVFAFAVLASPVSGKVKEPACPSSLCGSNVIQNPGADAGTGSMHDTIVPIPDWTVTSGGFTAVSYSWPGGNLSPTSPGPPDRGSNYFYGGPGPHGDAAHADQTYTFSGTYAAVERGLVTATLSGWLGGAINHEDHAQVSVAFLNGFGKVLSKLVIGPVPLPSGDGNDALHERTAKAPVPPATVAVRINILMTRYLFGAPKNVDNNGMVDSLSLVFSCFLCQP